MATMVNFEDKTAVMLQKGHGKMVTTVRKIGHRQNDDHGAFVDKIAVMMHKRTRKKWCLWYEKKNMDKLATMVLKEHGQNGDHGTKGTWKTRYPSKSSIEVTTCTSSNILVWFGRDATEKGVAGSQRGSFLVPLQLQRD